MGVKVKGLAAALRRTTGIFGEITGVKVIRALKSATFIIRTDSATRTPIDTSKLINSQYDTIVFEGTRITSKIGYSAKYAVYVHESKGYAVGKAIPRASGNGNYWNPHGEPKFLEKAADATKILVDKAVAKEMKL